MNGKQKPRQASTRVEIECEPVQITPGNNAPNAAKSGYYFYILRRGRLRIDTMQTREIAGPGQIVFCPAWERRRITAVIEPVRMITLRIRHRAFAPDTAADTSALDCLMILARWTTHNGHILTPGPSLQKNLSGLLAGLCREQRRTQTGAAAILKAGAMTFLAWLGREPWLDGTRSTIPGPAYRNIQQALRYIEDHADSPISIQQLAQSAALSRSHFQAVFRSYTGISAKSYVTRYRINRACRALLTTEQSVIQIAFDAGFHSLSRFYAAFSKIVGMPPAAFRKHHQQSPGAQVPGRPAEGPASSSR